MQKEQVTVPDLNRSEVKMRETWKLKISIMLFIMALLLIIMFVARCSYQLPTQPKPFLVFHPEDSIPPDWFLDMIDTSSNPPDTIFINWDSLSSQLKE